MNINGIKRDPVPPWTERSAGPRPTKLDRDYWLCEVERVIGGTGGTDEGLYWTVVHLKSTPALDHNAEFAAGRAATSWYIQTDQSGAESTVAFRVTAWTGEQWVVEVWLDIILNCNARKAVRVREPARGRDGGGR